MLTLGVLVGLGLGMIAPTAAPALGEVWWPKPPQPLAAASSASWTPKIAFQHYATESLDAKFLAEHIDWLMLRYGAEELRDEVRDLGYTNVLPQYMLLFQIVGPGPLRRSNEDCKDAYTPLQNNVMFTRDFCKQVHPHEDWFLHNGKGERLYTEERLWDGSHAYQYFMNPGSAGFRAFWIAQMRSQGDAGWDSLFLDNVAATYTYIKDRADNGRDGVAEYDSVEAWQGAVVGMLRAIRAAFPMYQLWGNIVEAAPTDDAWERYRPELDGIQEENFATGWARGDPLPVAAWEAMLVRAERTLAQGKRVVLYGQGEQNDFARMRLSLASYLLVTTPDQRATFRYTHTNSYETIWWYPEYEQDLGSPQGARYQEGDVWMRRFACALVTVDPQQRSGVIKRLPCPRGPTEGGL